MSGIIVVAIAAVAIVVVSLAGRAAGKRLRAAHEAAASEAPGAAPAADRQLVAVIAAAVAATSGMEPGAFRIVGVTASQNSVAQRGFNTPVWGHIDRIPRGEST